MGMQSRLEQISAEQLTAYVQNPRLAYESFLTDLTEGAGDMLPQRIAGLKEAADKLPPAIRRQVEQQLLQFEKKMLALSQRPRLVTAAVEEPKRFSLEKDWHMLHYALTGTAEPGDTWISKSILGGRELPDVDGVMGYGPLRFLDANEVQSVSHELETVDPQTLIFNLNQEDATRKRIYLSHTLSNLHDWDYLPQLFTQFRDFYADAAEHGNAILLSIT